jgi:hypothetical protein
MTHFGLLVLDRNLAAALADILDESNRAAMQSFCSDLRREYKTTDTDQKNHGYQAEWAGRRWLVCHLAMNFAAKIAELAAGSDNPAILALCDKIALATATILRKHVA